MSQSKRCGNCGVEKPFEEFHKHKKHGTQTQCITCMSQHKQRWREMNPNRQIGQAMEKRHGITLLEYEERLDSQNGVCANPLCDRSAKDNPRDRRLAIDHDHRHCASRNGCVRCIRGLLCQRCNLILGQVQDDETVLQGLIEYLQAALVAEGA